MKHKNNKLLIICGPTATGKTGLALQLAEAFNGELVSCDSRQVYKYMDVITGKDVPKEFRIKNTEFSYLPLAINYYTDGQRRIWGYHLVRPDQEFHVQLYLEFACRVLADIWQRGKLPIVVGGTGFYLQSLINPPQTLGVPINKQLRSRLRSKQTEELYKLLLKKAPMKALQMTNSDKLNPPRLIRALEVVTYQGADPLTLSPLLSEYIESIKHVDTVWVGLKYAQNRELYSQIDRRVEDRLTNKQLVDELDYLMHKDYLRMVPARTIGYQQLIAWMGGEISFADALKKWQFAEHNYARRQLTWFKKQPHIHWINISNHDWQKPVVKLVTEWYTK